MKRLQEEQNLNRNRASGLVVAILIFVVFFLSAGRIFVANRLVESSDKLRKMDSQIALLESQNQSLSEDVRHLESTKNIEQQAQSAGFKSNSHFAVLTSSPQVAYGHIQ